MLEAKRRCGSWVEFSATTAKTTSPGERYFNPWERASSLHWGGKMDETRTKFCAAMPASRNASSKEVSRSRCLPTPLVKKIFLGTMFFPNAVFLRVFSWICQLKSNTVNCDGNVKSGSITKLFSRRRALRRNEIYFVGVT